MKKFDWKTKFSNKAWDLALIAALFVLIGAVLHAFGYDPDLSKIQDSVVAIVNGIFSVMMILGVVMNPNTPGVTDPDPQDEDEELESPVIDNEVTVDTSKEDAELKGNYVPTEEDGE